MLNTRYNYKWDTALHGHTAILSPARDLAVCGLPRSSDAGTLPQHRPVVAWGRSGSRWEPVASDLPAGLWPCPQPVDAAGALLLGSQPAAQEGMTSVPMWTGGLCCAGCSGSSTHSYCTQSSRRSYRGGWWGRGVGAGAYWLHKTQNHKTARMSGLRYTPLHCFSPAASSYIDIQLEISSVREAVLISEFTVKTLANN